MQTAPTATVHFLITILLPVLCIIGALGNLLICMVICLDRRLHNVINYFLFSLALADLFVCTFVMPISFIVEVHRGKWQSSFELCLVYVYSDVFLCTASIVHMSVISIDRYLGISKPLKTRNHSKTLITLKIIFVWIITILISCPIAIAALIDPTNILSQSRCLITNRYYMIYGSTFAFLIPFLIMAATYVKTTNLLKKQASLLSQTAMQRTRGEGLRRTLPKKPGFTSSTFNEISHKMKTVTECPSTSGKLSTTMSAFDDALRLLNVNNEENNQIKENKLKKLCVRTSSVFLLITSKFATQHSQKTEEIANEHKATRVLAVVFGCFFICWTPFFAVNLANGFFGDRCNIPPTVSSLFLWLGYISSTVNPLIYTIFNRRFRQAVFRIISCKCFNSSRNLNSANCSRSHAYPPADTNTWLNYERAQNYANAYASGNKFYTNMTLIKSQEKILTAPKDDRSGSVGFSQPQQITEKQSHYEREPRNENQMFLG